MKNPRASDKRKKIKFKPVRLDESGGRGNQPRYHGRGKIRIRRVSQGYPTSLRKNESRPFRESL